MFCFGFEGNPKIQNVHITSRHNIYWKSTKIPSIKTIWLINHVFCHLIRPMYSYAVHETNNNLNFYHSNTHIHTNLRVPIYMFKIEWYFHNSQHIEFDFVFHYFWFSKYVSSQFGNMKSWKSQTYGFSLCAFAIAFSPAVFPRYRRWFFFICLKAHRMVWFYVRSKNQMCISLEYGFLFSSEQHSRRMSCVFVFSFRIESKLTNKVSNTLAN